MHYVFDNRVMPGNLVSPQSQKKSWFLIVFVLCWGLTGWPGIETAWSQKTEVIQGGRHLFEKFCVTCHGQGATGDGPLADSFSPPPADLTTLTKRNRGTFPFWRAYSIIDGRQHLSAHGTRDMPVFGIWFRIPDDEVSIDSEWADQVRGRIWQLLSFLESIQAS